MPGANSRQDDSDHFSLPPMVFYALLCAAGLGGSGIYGVVGQSMEKGAVEQCYDNSRTALDVVAQHGAELNAIRALIYEKTAERWTASEEAKFQGELEKQLRSFDRRVASLEREMDKIHAQ